MSLSEFPNTHVCAAVPHPVLAIMVLKCEHVLSTTVSHHQYVLDGDGVTELTFGPVLTFGPLDPAVTVAIAVGSLTTRWALEHHRW